MIFPVLISLFVISSILTSCGDKGHQVQLEMRDSLIYLKGTDSLFTGTERAAVHDKTVIYDVVKGKKNGSFKILYADGNPQITGTMVDNSNEGKWSYYYPDSKIESAGLFKNNLPEGEWKWYFDSGKLKEVGGYVKGRRNGKWLQFDKSGNIVLQKYFKDGEEIKNPDEEKSSVKREGK